MQWYSNTLGGIMADNRLTDVNVLNGGNVGNASVGAYGACYNGPGPVWFTEFTGVPLLPIGRLTVTLPSAH